MFVNYSSYSISVQTEGAWYEFPSLGYHAENVELLPHYDSGTLTRVASTYPADNPTAVEATRHLLYTPVVDPDIADIEAKVDALDVDVAVIDTNVNMVDTNVDTIAARSSALVSNVGTVWQDIALLHRMEHSRIRVYPRAPSATIQVTAGGGADTWGLWTQVVPANTVLFLFHVFGVKVEDAENADTFLLQFANAAAPADTEILGEVRFVYDAIANNILNISMSLEAAHCDANDPVYCRAMGAAGGLWVKISVEITRHFALNYPHITHWPDWPW